MGEPERRQLDLTDPAVRTLAKQNHIPAEEWTVGGELIGVYCDKCRQSWPCATVVRLRERGDRL